MTDLENETGSVEDMTPDYLAAIKELKQNSVDRSEYEKLRAENKKLLNSVVNGQFAEQEEQVVIHTQKEIQALRNSLFNPDKDRSNLEYVSTALELRTALIENGEPDPFLPQMRKYNPTRDDVEAAERCAQIYQECIDYAQGDSEAFTNELMRRTRDVRVR